jgi:hypothetical protein
MREEIAFMTFSGSLHSSFGVRDSFLETVEDQTFEAVFLGLSPAFSLFGV